MSHEYTSREGTCPVCNLTDVAAFVEIFHIPVHCNLLWATREESLQAPRGDIRLGFCHHCGHIFNLAFNPELMEYTQAYENSLHFSPHFRSYAESLARRLIDRHDLYGKDIIEIGCGRGDFLRLLCELGDSQGVGFDPSYAPEPNANVSTERVTFIQDFYSERYFDYKADLVCCRHVLEHIQFPRDFLAGVRHAIGNRLETIVFFEVPNVLFTLRNLGIWDLIYEHCSYFSPGSLSRLFALCRFDVCDLTETYADQFLCIEALPSAADFAEDGPCADLEDMASDVVAFANKYRSKVEIWRSDLERIVRIGQRTVVWGAGSKGVAFLNTLKIQDQIEYVVDINPRKQGMYVAGTGQQIVPPEFLRGYQPDVMIVMNPVYEDEIRQLTQSLGLTPEFMCA